MPFQFEQLEVWKKAIDLVDYVYGAGKFPHDEHLGLRSQIRRSTVSIALNIAEGSGRKTKKDQQHIYYVAVGSLREAVAAALICQKRGYISVGEYRHIYSELEWVSKMLFGLIKSLSTNNRP